MVFYFGPIRHGPAYADWICQKGAKDASCNGEIGATSLGHPIVTLACFFIVRLVTSL
jgi:hypothetical protein